MSIHLCIGLSQRYTRHDHTCAVSKASTEIRGVYILGVLIGVSRETGSDSSISCSIFTNNTMLIHTPFMCVCVCVCLCVCECVCLCVCECVCVCVCVSVSVCVVH